MTSPHTKSLFDDLDGLDNISKEEMEQIENILKLSPRPEDDTQSVDESPLNSPLATTYNQPIDSADISPTTKVNLPNVAEESTEDSEESKDQAGELRREISHPIPEPWSPAKDSTRSTFSEPVTAGRKLSDAFSWLSRKATGKVSPTASPASAMVMSPGTAFDQNEIDEHGQEQKNTSFSLQERFKLVRMRQDTGLSLMEHNAENRAESEHSQSRGGSMASSPTEETFQVQTHDEKDANDDTAGSPQTAVPAHDSETDGPVDWDLWQQVVYEGPAAVARQSPDELSQAIARGIPSAIRGVVWQVLAQSKNEDLETVYRQLVAKSAQPERKASRSMSGLNIKIPHFRSQESSPVRAGRTQRKNSVSSFASSLRSTPENSRSRTSSVHSAAAVHSTSTTSVDESVAARLQESIDERDTQSSEEAAALMKLEKSIRRDLGARTSYSKFLMSAGLQDGLFGVCKAYALYDEGVGYAQGMNFIAMPLLFNMPEEEAFCLFVRLMHQYKLRDMFTEGMPGLHLHLYQFERVLEALEPAIYCHLHRRGVAPQLYATQWFLTLFAYRFPLQLVVRIYDLILSEGLEGAIIKFGVALMRKNAKKILELNDMAVLSSFLKEGLFDIYIDKAPSATSVLESGFFGRAGGVDKQVYRADELVRDACAVEATSNDLSMYAEEWSQRVQDEKKKQAADDVLRASNASLLLQVKSLQDRVEKGDIEHVQVASELVRVKVENDRVMDEVEGLRTQVQELRNIIQSQPNEVESKLKEEMDRIMKRNVEVQEENRALEDSMADMEKELVNAKLSNAEISGELDNMRQKWNTVTSMLGTK